MIRDTEPILSDMKRSGLYRVIAGKLLELGRTKCPCVALIYQRLGTEATHTSAVFVNLGGASAPKERVKRPDLLALHGARDELQ